MKPTPKVYCSGPLFCAEEVGAMQAIADTLEAAGMRTFLPHRDGLEPWVMRFANAPGQNLIPPIRRRIDQAIFALDVYELIEDCDAIVFNMNGRVPDEGGVVEASIAFAAGKPVVLYKRDIRAPFGGQDNAMLLGLTGGRVIAERRALPDAVREAVERGGQGVTVSPSLAAAVESGRRVSKLLARLPEKLGKQRWDEDVLSRELAAVDGEDEQELQDA